MPRLALYPGQAHSTRQKQGHRPGLRPLVHPTLGHLEQRRGIESRLLIFPTGNHWVLQPADSVQWYQNVLAWLDAHLKK